ncbi:hypothetical protein ACHAPX_010550 [Trichoderma viride]|jgi:hypothetical protein
MGLASAPSEFDVQVDIFGQRWVTIFTQISFCFALTNDHDVERIVDTLIKGNDRLSHHFPWLAGQVVQEGGAYGNTGVFKIKPLDATPRMTIRDMRDSADAPSWNALVRSGFDMNHLDEGLVAPRKSNSGRPGETVAEVFQFQATIIAGGLVLTFLGQHQSMDGTGLAQAIRLFSKACRLEEFTAEELAIGTFSSGKVVPLLGDTWRPGPELRHNIIKQDMSAPGPGSHRSKSTGEKGVWCHFDFPAFALETLKLRAAQTKPDTISYISTDDALSAFIMQAIGRVRLLRFDPAAEMLCARAVDLRPFLDMPRTHPGFVQSMTYHHLPMGQAASCPLGELAARFRAEIDPKTTKLPYHGRSLATLISRTTDRSAVSYVAGFDMSKDVMISSWVNQESYKLDFGLGLGLPHAVRRPRFESFQGLVYLMPKAMTGDIGVAICLNASDMDGLKADAEFTKYTKSIA